MNASIGDSLFSTVSRIPHGVCLTWDPVLVWTLAASHFLVGLAYLAIPISLLVFIRRQRGLRFSWMFVLFGAFIFACGATHFISLMNIWRPDYGLEAIVMAITAVVSVATAATLVPLIPVASNYINEKTETEQALHKMNIDLQDQMERFFDLAVAQRSSQAELLALHDASPLGEFRADALGVMTHVNRMFETISGWPSSAVLGTAWSQIIHPEDRLLTTTSWAGAVAAGSRYESRHRMLKPDGTVVWVSAKAAPVWLDETVIGYVGSVDDVTALHQADLALKASQQREEDRLRSLLLTDGLTGLGNRNGFEQSLQAAADRHARNPQLGVAVLFADLDRLKLINDSLGHAMGDRLLQHFAARLRDGVRVTDYCARWGGDEFTVVLENIHGPADIEALCEKLLQEMSRPFLIDDVPHALTASIGAACHLAHSPIDIETLLKQADNMLYVAKREGRNTYRMYPLG